MPGNTIGSIFRLTTFGESHGMAVGGIIDGCPSNIALNMEMLHADLQRRSPKGDFFTDRRENEKITFLSGIFEGKTLGTPIAFQIANEHAHSEEYQKIKEVYRPSHADRVYEEKYQIRDHRGGGRASGRETAARVAGGAIAKQILLKENIEIFGFVSQIGNIALQKDYTQLDLQKSSQNEVCCPDQKTAEKMLAYLQKIKEEKDSAGGVIQCVIKGCPAGLGEPVFNRLSADLAKAMLSIGSAKGFEFGSGFESAAMRGNCYLDVYQERFKTETNHSGGIQGGISTGEDIYFSTVFHPVASIQKPIPVISKEGKLSEITLGGRHDVCHVPRIVPVIESMSAIILLDHLLRYRSLKCSN